MLDSSMHSRYNINIFIVFIYEFYKIFQEEVCHGKRVLAQTLATIPMCERKNGEDVGLHMQ